MDYPGINERLLSTMGRRRSRRRTSFGLSLLFNFFLFFRHLGLCKYSKCRGRALLNRRRIVSGSIKTRINNFNFREQTRTSCKMEPLLFIRRCLCCFLSFSVSFQLESFVRILKVRRVGRKETILNFQHGFQLCPEFIDAFNP